MSNAEKAFSGTNQVQLMEAGLPVFTENIEDSGRFRVGLQGVQKNSQGQPKRCAKSYVVTDPVEIGRKLELAGFKVTKIHFNRKGNSSLVEARYPSLHGMDVAIPEYMDFCKVVLDHRGRLPILLQPGALRMACLNQFTAPAVRFHHCTKDAQEFVLDPSKFAFDARYLAVQAKDRLEGLRNVYWTQEPLDAFSGLPKLRERVRKAWNGSYHGEFTVWAALQAMTHTKSPRLVGLTCRALSEGYSELQAGRVPACWINN